MGIRIFPWQFASRETCSNTLDCKCWNCNIERIYGVRPKLDEVQKQMNEEDKNAIVEE